MIEDKSLLSEYLSESEELVDSLLADLDMLGARNADPDISLINRIFRTMHSFKGLSGMMGLTAVQSLAHEFEDILDSLRLGKISLDKESVAALQEAGAGLASLVIGAARGSAEEQDFTRLRELLAAIASRPRPRKKKERVDLESLNLSERERRMLTDFERHRIAENFNAGRAIYALVVQFDISVLDTQYRAFTSKLSEIGELITTLPETASGATLVAFKLLVATQRKESDLKRMAEPHGGRVTRIGPSSWRRAGAALKSVGRKQKQSSEEGEHPIDRVATLLPTNFAQESLQPLSPSVRVELSQIDELSGLAHELAIETESLSSMADRFLIAAGFGARERFDLRQSARRLERQFLELEERLVELRMVSLAQTFTRAARLAGRLARDLGKSVSVELAGRETQLDKMIVDRIADPIYHILRNAIDHGIELPEERKRAGKSVRGKIKMEGSLEGARAVISISDDGGGIAAAQVRRRALEIGAIAPDEELSEEETLRLIFRPGFSTADQVSAVSGRGVGLDAVERAIHELGGEIRVYSEPGRGSKFELAVPTTLVMISAFIVKVGEWRYAINVGQIVELLYVSPDDVLGRDGKRNISWRGSTIPLIELRYLLGLGGARVFRRPETFGRDGSRDQSWAGSALGLRLPVFVARAGERCVAIAVEQFEMQREIIVKSLGSLAQRIKGVTGAVDLEGGDVALVLDLSGLLLLRSLRM